MIDIREHGGSYEGSSGSNIKSIQRGLSELINNTYSLNVPIANVDINRSVVIVNEAIAFNGASPADIKVKAKLINGNTLNLAIGSTSGGSGSAKISWQIIEYKDIKSLQTGELLFNTTTQNVNISDVNIDKSILIFSFNTTHTTYALQGLVLRGHIANDNTLTFYTGSASQAKINWQLVEFK